MDIKFWNKAEGILLADGTPATPEEVMAKWPFARHVPVVLEACGPLVMAIEALPVLVSVHGLDPTLTENQQLEAYREIRAGKGA